MGNPVEPTLQALSMFLVAMFSSYIFEGTVHTSVLN